MSGTAEVRLGVEGSLSATSSPIANKVTIPTVTDEPIKANLVPSRTSRFRCAAQATAAGAVIERSPAITPIPKAIAYTFVKFMAEVYHAETVSKVASS